MKCPFCDIAGQDKNRVIRSTEHTFTTLSNPRLMLGHLLIIPKRHVEKLSELTREERADLFEEVTKVQEKVLAVFAKGCDIS